MKLLNRLRELRIEDPVEQLFENFHYSIESFNHEIIGLGATTHDDIKRVNNETFHIEKKACKNS